MFQVIPVCSKAWESSQSFFLWTNFNVNSFRTQRPQSQMLIKTFSRAKKGLGFSHTFGHIEITWNIGLYWNGLRTISTPILWKRRPQCALHIKLENSKLPALFKKKSFVKYIIVFHPTLQYILKYVLCSSNGNDVSVPRKDIMRLFRYFREVLDMIYFWWWTGWRSEISKLR